ncbi:MAG: hypothetical protein IKX06_04140 [Clostridia bacterium]|nr:hypothetical protein [Clostridia bacterium]
MYKGRNVLLVMICLLGVSILTFLTLFERSNTSGVADGVRYIVASEEDGVKYLEFYFKDPDVKATGTATDAGNLVIFTIDGSDCTYTVDKETLEVGVTGGGEGDPFGVYTQKLFRLMVKGKDRFIKFWQAIIVGVVALAGGAVILFAEEIWHVIYKKRGDEIPAWKDMNGIKIAGGAVIGAAAVLLIIFILI